jgi:N-acetylneuraminic acid mutarotase
MGISMSKSVALLLVLFFLMSLFAVQVKPVSATNDVTEDSWVGLEPLPTIRRDLGVAVVDGKIYAIGGRNDNGWLSTNEEYDPVTDTWTTKTPMPTPRSDFGIAVVQNKIYCIGGIIDYDWSGYGKGILCAVNEVYDPLTDTWENKTSMPTERQRPLANAVNGKIYLIGGFQYRNLPPPQTTIQLEVNEVYDPETDSWTTKTPMPNTSSGPVSTTVDNKIFIISGFQTSLTQVYDAESDTWSQGADIPTAVGLAGAGATTGEMAPKRIYVIGGYPSYDEEPLNQIYDPQTDTWVSGRQMLTARHSLGMAVVNDTLFAIGGGSSNLNVRYYDENERYIPIGYVTEPPDADKPTPPPTEPFPITLLVATVAIVAAVGAGLVVYFKKRKH